MRRVEMPASTRMQRALRVDDQAVPLGAAGQSMYCNHVAVPSKNARHKDKTSARRKRQTLEFLLNASADLCLVLGRFDRHIRHLNVRADRAELADKILIASLDKLNLADLGCPRAARPAITSAAPARRSHACTGAPSRCSTPSITATRPST